MSLALILALSMVVASTNAGLLSGLGAPSVSVVTDLVGGLGVIPDGPVGGLLHDVANTVDNTVEDVVETVDNLLDCLDVNAVLKLPGGVPGLVCQVIDAVDHILTGGCPNKCGRCTLGPINIINTVGQVVRAVKFCDGVDSEGTSLIVRFAHI